MNKKDILKSERIISQYMDDVLSDKTLSCKHVKAAVNRHIDDLKNGADRGLKFSPAHAQHRLDFYQHCKHSKGKWGGQVFKPEPWQMFIKWCQYGWLTDQNTRRFEISYVSVARKNGKSTDCATDGLYLLDADNEPGAEIYNVASKLDQARIVHQESINMVRKSADLSSVINVFKNNLSVDETASKYECLGSDSKTLDGLNIHAALCDEMHAWKKGNELWSVIDTATGAREQPFKMIITTRGFDRQTICYELEEYGLKIINNITDDDSFFCIVYTLDTDDDWKDPDLWIKANPNLGVSVKIDSLEKACRKAINIITEQNSFKCKRMNLWTNQSERWIDMDMWNENFTNDIYVF